MKEFKIHSAETVSESELKRESRDLCKTKNVIKVKPIKHIRLTSGELLSNDR